MQNYFSSYPIAAVAFSGGVDSAYLLWLCKKYCKKTKAYFVKTEFQPQFEAEDAKVLAGSIGTELEIIEMSVLDNEIRSNPHNRCYFCKRKIMSKIKKKAESDGFKVIFDGTNASDDIKDRPGFAALTELNIVSPLRELGLSKSEIRRLSKDAELFTHDKPTYSCLATRIPTGTEISKEKLSVIEKAETYLFSLGFKDFRVRLLSNEARLEIASSQVSLLFEHRTEILKCFKDKTESVTLNLHFRDDLP